MKTRLIFYLVLFLSLQISAQTYRILEKSAGKYKIEVDFTGEYSIKDTTVDNFTYQTIVSKTPILRAPGEPALPSFSLEFALPFSASANVNIINKDINSFENIFIIPSPDYNADGSVSSEVEFNQQIYGSPQSFPERIVQLPETFQFRSIIIQPVVISPFQFDPLSRKLTRINRVVFELKIKNIDNNPVEIRKVTDDNLTDNFLNENVVNSKEAVNWKFKKITTNRKSEDYWYDPNKIYAKIYLNNKDVYRITYEQLSGFNNFAAGEIDPKSIEVYNNGVQIPLEVFDLDSNNVFGSGDYFQFIGYPASATDYCSTNIYNKTNIYWLSLQGDTSKTLRYREADSFPGGYTKTFQQSLVTLHFEKDTLYERLGYAEDDKRDFWFWGKASGKNGIAEEKFEARFNQFQDINPLLNSVTLRVDMHGMTKINCSPDHDAVISITDQKIGSAQWDGQSRYTFESSFTVGENGIHIFPEGNLLQVETPASNSCTTNSDNIRINWFEFDYWRDNRIYGNHYFFSSPKDEQGLFRYWLWNWNRDTVKVYVPQNNKILTNVQVIDDADKTILFQDRVSNQQVDYFLVDDTYYKSPDSIIIDEPSDLRNISNGADYIIVTNKKFSQAAQELASFRTHNLPGINNARVYIATVDNIYDEFSYGLLDPFAIKNFVQYAYENWQGRAPSYLAILGDMSWDYRGILSESRPNFVPSVPYHSWTYGLAISDNLFAAVAGNDVVPDLAVGRISCETENEADILINKIENYPADDSKEWKENVLLIGAGESVDDENYFGFNDDSQDLDNVYVTANGYNPKKVFLFPNKPEYEQFQGGGPEIRNEFNNGVALSNFYGHGGGYQWDQVFLTDDIYLLENGGRMPMILSVTCYTAHFGNQNVFGEIFNKMEGKGSIGFWGNTGLTYYQQGTSLNTLVFDEIFSKKNTVMGDVFLNAKIRFAGTNPNKPQRDHIALLTYLGDPALNLALPLKPDFKIQQSQISMTPENPLVGDTVQVKAIFENIGRTFPGDSALVEITAVMEDTTFSIGTKKLSSFGQIDSVEFNWSPEVDGLINIQVKINEDDNIPEDDHSDNFAEKSFSVFDLSQPNIIKPIDGFYSNENKVEILAADIGYYIGIGLQYFIQIDTSLNFDNPIADEKNLTADEGLLTYNSPDLPSDRYFWRMRLFDGEKYSAWTDIRAFTLGSQQEGFGYLSDGRHLNLFGSENFNYSYDEQNLQLNIGLKPPKPKDQRFIDTLLYSDTVKPLTTITTDGTYIYSANMAYYNNWNNSFIYKYGTGYNGTEKGRSYGAVENSSTQIRSQIVYHKGYLYAAYGDAHKIKRIHPATGEVVFEDIPDGLISDSDGKVHDGFFFLTSDGDYIYNISFTDSLGSGRYFIRKFDVENNWTKVADIHLESSSYEGFSGSFIADGYFYPSESYNSNYMRRIRLSDGFLEEEWTCSDEFKSYFSWCYDSEHDIVYASVFGSGRTNMLASFVGHYKETQGVLVSPSVGPALSWESLKYSVNKTEFTGNYYPLLLGYSSSRKTWDTLKTGFGQLTDISDIDAGEYPNLKLRIDFSDSTVGVSQPAKFSLFQIQYESMPEVISKNSDFTFSPDSLLQGFPITMTYQVKNIGYSSTDTLSMDFRLDDSENIMLNKKIILPPDSSAVIEHIIPTENLAPHTSHKVSVINTVKNKEMFLFNNIAESSFYVARDSVKPEFSITFDGGEIFNGDIISAAPQIIITLSDNSPLPLDTTNFKLYLNNKYVSFKNDSLGYSYTPYPNSKGTITWNPKFDNGLYTLDFTGWDASNNWFDSVSYRISFNVNTENQIKDVYNYPNPFTDDTYFTFNLTGSKFPDDIYLRIFTMAGRLVKEIHLPVDELHFGFNKFYWDGKDEDGDEIGNGIYFAKIIYKNKDKVTNQILKLAKVK